MTRIKDLDNKVRFVLKTYPDSRNSDIKLTQYIWWFFYQKNMVMMDRNDNRGNIAYVAVRDLTELPREDNIKRIRAKIQNEEKLYLPTDPAVAKKRGWKEDEWRGYLGKSIAGVDNQYL